MVPFSVSDRKRPGPDRRSVEISKIIAEALEPVIFTEQFPRASVDIFIEVLEAEAGTRCAGLTAASVALADAGIPMKSLVAACAAGKVAGKVVLDLRKEEDNYGDADLPVAVIERTKEISLMQLDGDMSMDEFDQAFNLAVGGCNKLHALQRDALRRKYDKAPAAEQ
jgi:exosome complex component RRP41